MAAPLRSHDEGREVGSLESAPPETLVNWMLVQLEADIADGRREVGELINMQVPVAIPESLRAFRCARSGLGVRIRRFPEANPEASHFATGLFSLVDMSADDPNRFLCFFTGTPGFESRIYNAFDKLLVLKRAVGDYAIALDRPLTSAGPDAVVGQVYNTSFAPATVGERMLLMPRLLLDVKDVSQQADYLNGPKDAYIRHRNNEPSSLAFTVNGASGPNDPNVNCVAEEAIVPSSNEFGHPCWRFVIVLRRKPGVHIPPNTELVFQYQRDWKSPEKKNRSGNHKTNLKSLIHQVGQWTMKKDGPNGWDERVRLGRTIIQEWAHFHPQHLTTLYNMYLLPRELCASPPICWTPAFGHGTLDIRYYIKLNMFGERLSKHITFASPPATMEYDQYPNAVHWLVMAAIARFSHPKVTHLYRQVVDEAAPVFNLLDTRQTMTQADAINVLRTAFLNIHRIFVREHADRFFYRSKGRPRTVPGYTSLAQGAYMTLAGMYAVQRAQLSIEPVQPPQPAQAAADQTAPQQPDDGSHGDLYNDNSDDNGDDNSDDEPQRPAQRQRMEELAAQDVQQDSFAASEAEKEAERAYMQMTLQAVEKARDEAMDAIDRMMNQQDDE